MWAQRGRGSRGWRGGRGETRCGNLLSSQLALSPSLFVVFEVYDTERDDLQTTDTSTTWKPSRDPPENFPLNASTSPQANDWVQTLISILYTEGEGGKKRCTYFELHNLIVQQLFQLFPRNGILLKVEIEEGRIERGCYGFIFWVVYISRRVGQ